MGVNKYDKDLVKLDNGAMVPVTQRVVVPTERDGKFRTSDGREYQRDSKTGQIRRVRT